ncbi:MAG TPA: pyridoxal-phosphate dependent enzyme [Candidatus Limnocylindrales bacterium]|nr:pyridoxal-phosphate dependent enzyme [Candidatus Limnocylindrales bacterium]
MDGVDSPVTQSGRRDPLGPAGAESLEPAAVEHARTVVDPVFLDSPQFVHDELTAAAGRVVVVKVETVNPIGAFKGRGTWAALAGLVGEGTVGPERPVVVASTGNFGAGVAYAGRALGVPVVVFAPRVAPVRKLERIRRLGATLVQAGDDFDAARAAAARFAAEGPGELLVDGQDPRIALGAGTIAAELTDAARTGRLPAPAAIYVPVGNGSLIVGLGTWLCAALPGCRVVGVQSEAAPAMTLSWRAGRPVETPTAATFADGIATRVPVPEAVAAMRDRVDDMVLVSEEALRAAQAALTAALGVTVEGAAAASWAGLLADPAPPDGPAVVVVTGSNVDRP